MKSDFEDCLVLLKDKLLNDDYAHKMYTALCNTVWSNIDTGDVYSCSWRYAGGLIARVRSLSIYDFDENYLVIYCSGNEGFVDVMIKDDLARFGWTPQPFEISEKDDDKISG